MNHGILKILRQPVTTTRNSEDLKSCQKLAEAAGDHDETKKRGSYSKISPKDKAVVGRYTSENGVTKALQHFKGKDLKASTVRDWKKAYEVTLLEKRKSAEPGKAVTVNSLDGKKRGRPPLLGTKLDLLLQERIIAMRDRGTSIGSGTVI